MGGGEEWDDDASDGGAGLEVELLQREAGGDAFDIATVIPFWNCDMKFAAGGLPSTPPSSRTGQQPFVRSAPRRPRN